MLMMLPYGARAPRMGASSAQLGLFFSLFGAFYASLQIARFQRITEASGALLVRFGGAPDAPAELLLRPPKPRKKSRRIVGEASLELS